MQVCGESSGDEPRLTTAWRPSADPRSGESEECRATCGLGTRALGVTWSHWQRAASLHTQCPPPEGNKAVYLFPPHFASHTTSCTPVSILFCIPKPNSQSSYFHCSRSTATVTMSAPNPTEQHLHSESATPSNTTSASTSRPTGAGVNTGAGMTRPKTEAELEADRLYEERMEEEYAKREGGA